MGLTKGIGDEGDLKVGEKAEKAKELFEQGYNCCQSVLGAFCEDVDLDFVTALKLSSSFGDGMGKLREVCGAVSAMFMVIGLKYGYTSPVNQDEKAGHYQLIQQLAGKFKDKRGTILCRELLGMEGKDDSFVPSERTKEYYQARPCTQIIGEAAEILEILLQSESSVGDNQ